MRRPRTRRAARESQITALWWQPGRDRHPLLFLEKLLGQTISLAPPAAGQLRGRFAHGVSVVVIVVAQRGGNLLMAQVHLGHVWGVQILNDGAAVALTDGVRPEHRHPREFAGTVKGPAQAGGSPVVSE